MAAVTFSKVRKAFGTAVAVKGLDLAVEDGEFVSLLWPLRLAQDDDAAHARRPRVPDRWRDPHRERVVNAVPPGQRDIAMVFQIYALYPHRLSRRTSLSTEKRRVPAAERAAKWTRWRTRCSCGRC